MRIIPVAALCGLLVGCAQSSAIPLSKTTFQLTTAAAPVCGPTGAQRTALKSAAIETIRKGYPRFTINGTGYANTTRVVGYTPVAASTTHSGSVYGNSYSGSSYTNVYGGQPIIGGGHVQKLVVKMYRQGDRGFNQAIDAKQTLGKDWKKLVKSGVQTCG